MKTIEKLAYKLTSDCIWNSFQSSKKKHIVITGARRIGKTTLLKKLFPNELPGITTWAIPQTAVYLKENITGKTIAVGTFDPTIEGTENKMRLISEGFSTLGIEALENTFSTASDWISIDEIGYLESQCEDYLHAITNIMKEKHVIAIVRKQNLSHLRSLCQRDDVFLIDLDAPLGNTGCVIMASGLGKRFGSNKLMADFCGTPLISRILDATEDIFSKRVVVTRHEDIAKLCKDRNIEVILHDYPHRNDTIRLGLESLLDTDQCMFCTSDQPLLTKDTIMALTLSSINTPERIIRPMCEDIPGSPVIFPKWAYNDLLQLPEGKGGGYIIKKHIDAIHNLSITNSLELDDIDTEEDFLRMKDLY